MDDFVECISDFMEFNYNIQDEDDRMEVLAAVCLTIREEFVATVENDG